MELSDTYQEELVRSLETALQSPTVPPEIIQTILNLAEFMEQGFQKKKKLNEIRRNVKNVNKDGFKSLQRRED